MADMTHEKILRTLIKDETYRDLAYQAMVNEDYIQDDGANKIEFVNTIKQPVTPGPTMDNPVPPPGATPAQMYAGMTSYGRQLLIADLAIPLCKRRDSSNFLIGSGIGGLAAAALLWFGNSMVPSVSVDEERIQNAISKQYFEVSDYVRSHDGIEPPWKRTDMQIRDKYTKNNDTPKDLLLYTGIASLILGLGALGTGIAKRL